MPEPQWDEWWKKPNTCYAKGLLDGVKMGREQAYREIFDGFCESIGVSSKVHFKEAMERQIREIERAASRKAWDATSGMNRVGDRQGKRNA
jgi:hypothetical protein